MDRTYLNPAEAMGFARPEVVAGFRLSYRFR